jgi:uncharacterized protein DUF5047
VITVSSTASSVLAGAGFVYQLAVESWLNGVLLADSVPVEVAGEETDRSLAVPERLTLTVPRWVDGVDWAPKSAISPLAAKGQRLHVKLGIGLANGQTEWITRGRFLIYNSEADDTTVDVQAVGLLYLIHEARLISPYQPSGTLASTLRGLVEPALNILVDSTVTDRSVPSAINYDEDRLGAVQELLDAWPAYGYVDPEGYLRVTSATQSTTPVFALSDAYGGTVISASGSSSREDSANAIVARGTASDGSQVQGVSYLTTGPNAYGGAFNPLPVPYFFQSPLLTTVTQAQAAADTIRNRRQLQTGREFIVETVPDPTRQVGDVGTLTSAANGLTNELVSVERLSLPYTAAEGGMPAMVLQCRTLA